jgi:RNA polymerase sigma-70 factor, ECF subfamily
LRSHINRKAFQQQVRSPRSKTSGDRDGLNNVLGSQRQRLFRAALRLLGNSEDAEDAVQEGLLAALRNLHRFEGRSRLSTWLMRIVLNSALMRLRSRNAHELEPIDEPMMPEGSRRLSDLLVDGRPNPEEVCARTEQRRILHQGLECLSRPQRRALSLHDFEGLTTKETALALGLSEGTVKSQVHRARRKLSKQVRRIQEEFRLFTKPSPRRQFES